MPTLKGYTDGSPKSGAYILANVGGAHPITLQVTTLAEQILNKAGYESGDNVPTKVVWSMFDVGLLYTSGIINDPPEVEEATDEIFSELNVASKLSAGERTQLLTYLREYTGPNEQQVRDFEQQLEQSEPKTETEMGVDESVIEGLERLSRLNNEGQLTDEEYKLLKSRLLDTATQEDDSAVSGSSSEQSTARAYLTERQIDDLVESYRDALPADSFDSDGQLIIDIPKHSVVIPRAWNGDPPPIVHMFSFDEQGQKERLQNWIHDRRFEVVMDMGGQEGLVVSFGKASPGYRDEVSDEDIRQEIECCFETIEYIYDFSSPEDVFSKFEW